MQKYRVKAIVMVALVLGIVNGALLFGVARRFIDISPREAVAATLVSSTIVEKKEIEVSSGTSVRFLFLDGLECVYISSTAQNGAISCNWPKAK